MADLDGTRLRRSNGKGRLSGRWAVMVAVLALLGLALPAGATTTRTDVTGTQQLVAVVPGTSWASGPMLHMRGQQEYGFQFPDASTGLPPGTIATEVNFNLNTATGKGRVWGTASVDYGSGGFETTFQGEIRPTSTGPIAEFTAVGHGYGTYEGMHVRLEVTATLFTGSSTFEGVMFMPGDR